MIYTTGAFKFFGIFVFRRYETISSEYKNTKAENETDCSAAWVKRGRGE